MKVFDKAAAWFGYEKKATSRSPWDNFWYTDPQTGFKMPDSMWFGVTPDSAMRVTAVLACVRVLAETIASLPLHIYRRLPNEGKEKVADHPLYNLLHLRPNPWQTSFEWREMLQGHLALRGNAICEKIPGSGGTVSDLIPLHPDGFKKVELVDNGEIRYTYQQPNAFNRPVNAEERILYSRDVLHLKGLSSDGIMGLSVVALAADTIGLSKAAELFGSKFFSKGAKASGVAIHPGVLSEPAHKNLRESISNQISGDNIHSPLILEEGMTWTQLSVSPEDAQFLETRKFQVADIARIFRIPLHMVQEHEKTTSWGTGVEQMNIGFVVHTLRPWLVRWEQAISRDLIAEDDIFAEFLVDGLLRGDIKSRYVAYGMAIKDGWMNRNKARELENMNPEEGLDEYLVPMNMSPTGKEKEEGQARTFNALFDDAAERVANAEIRTIEKRIGKAAEDREKFNKWIESFYKTHAAYMTKVLMPLSYTLREETGEGLPVEAIVQELATEGIEAFTKAEPVDALAAWKEAREENIVMMLRGATNGQR